LQKQHDADQFTVVVVERKKRKRERTGRKKTIIIHLHMSKTVFPNDHFVKNAIHISDIGYFKNTSFGGMAQIRDSFIDRKFTMAH